MARIAYIDHSFHKKTLSNAFLVDLLRHAGHEVELFWNDVWEGRAGFDFRRVKGFDIVLVFQVPCEIGLNYFRNLHPNVIFVPMLDNYVLAQGAAANHLYFCEPWHGSKVISFSGALHGVFSALGIASFRARFYPEPLLQFSPQPGQAVAPVSPAPPDPLVSLEAAPGSAALTGLRGFAWIRREDQVSWPLIRTLIGETRFESLHLHFAADPDTPPVTRPTPEEAASRNISLSDWFENKEDFWRVLERANVFFAPRLVEGIGMSFLEAMARGQCVVAPDRPTMNEYILHGVNGLLYDPLNPQALDFSAAIGRAASPEQCVPADQANPASQNIPAGQSSPADSARQTALGRNAQLSVQEGRKRWLEQERALLRFIETPSAEIYANLYKHPFIDSGYACAGFRLSWRQRLKSSWLLRKTESVWRPVWQMVKRINGRRL